MDNRSKALEWKKKGNTEFKAKNFKEAAEHYSEAIKLDPNDHVFFSNRSGCYTSLGRFEDALSDADICVEIKPDWPKGYTRKA